MKDENEMWQLIDDWINRVITPNEYLQSLPDIMTGDVRLKYVRVEKNHLYERNRVIQRSLLLLVKDETVLAILDDYIAHFREDD